MKIKRLNQFHYFGEIETLTYLKICFLLCLLKLCYLLSLFEFQADIVLFEWRRKSEYVLFQGFFWLKGKLLLHSRMILKLSLNGSKWSQMVSNGPPPIPIPASAKVSCEGANELEKNTLLMMFYHLYKKDEESLLSGID